MTGIAGWSDAGSGVVDPDALLARMCALLPPNGSGERRTLGQAAIGGLFRSPGVAASANGDVLVAIEGHPHWPDAEFAGLATASGSGEALLRLYEKHGNDCMASLGGDFALAIADRNGRQLTLAVDRMGIRPLCYANRAGKLVFGSTTDAVLAHPDIPTELSPQALFHFVYFHVVPSPRTVFAGVNKLEPAQRLTLRNGNVDLDYYWQPRFDRQRTPPANELAAELVETARDAVHRCVRDDSSATFLSGGLDSSTVSGLANEATENPVRAYSIGFDQQGYDEMAYARIAAGRYGLDHREYYVTPDDVADSLHVIATSYDEPFGNSSAIPAYFCASQARADGVSRLLAGDGGDELFAGNERYATQQVFEFYWKLPAPLRQRIVEPLAGLLPRDRPVILRKVRRYVEQAAVPMPARLQTYNFLHVNRPEDVFAGDFLQQTDAQSPLADLASWYGRSRDCDLVDRMLMLDWKVTLADNDLRKVNRMCEVNGIDVVYPLLDEALVDLSIRIPTQLKMRGRELRSFYKQAFSGFLPQEIIDKQKHGFGLPFGEWLATSSRLQDVVFPSIDRLKRRDIFRADFIDDLLDKHRNVHAAYYGNIIWVLTMLENWLAEHADKSASAPH